MLIVAIGDDTDLDEPLLRLAERGATVCFAGDRTSAARLLQGVPEPAPSVRLGDLHVDPRAPDATWRGRPLRLSPAEVRILGLLAGDPHRPFAFADIDAAVRGRRAYLGDSSPIRSSVKRLRRKLGAAGSSLAIESIRGVGFRLVTGNAGS